jgi:hypothetical protein
MSSLSFRGQMARHRSNVGRFAGMRALGTDHHC